MKSWVAGILVVAALATVGQGATIFKANNTNNLNQADSWVSGGPPGNEDVACWDSTVTAANSVLLGANMTWKGIVIANPGGLVTLKPGNTLTLGTAGIDMSAATQNLTIQHSFRAAATQTWTIGGSRTLTLDNDNTGSSYDFAGYDLILNGPGTLSIGQANPTNIATTWISNSRIGTGNRAMLTTSAMSISGTGKFEVVSFGGALTVITIGAGGLTITQPPTGAITPIKWLYGSSSNRRATMTLNGTFTLVGNAVNTNPVTVDVNAPSYTYGDGFFTWTGAREFHIGDGGAAVDLIFRPRILGSGSLIKTGSGTLALEGVASNLYAGGTIVSNGTLLVINTEGSGTGTNTVTVCSGATFGGTGSATGVVTVLNGGMLAPGVSRGTLTLGKLVLNDLSQIEFELGASWQYNGGNLPSPNDLVVVAGDLVLDGQLTVRDAGGLAPGTYTLFLYGGTLVDQTLVPLSLPEAYSGAVWVDTVRKAVNLTLRRGEGASILIR